MKKNKTWLGWILFAVIMGGGSYMGLSPVILNPVADSVAIAVQESTDLDN